jgi:protease-4
VPARRRGVVLVISLILLAVMMSAGAMLVLALFAGTPRSIPSNATLYLRIAAPFSEVEPSELLGQLLHQPPSLRSTIDAIARAKNDSRIKTLVIRPDGSGALWAQIEEVRAAVEDFKTSGKPVTAYLEAGDAGDYYLASVADRILMMPAGQLDLSGIASYEVFFRGALDKIGVYPDLLHIGEYKTASNTFTEKSFTPSHAEMTRSLNRDWYDELVRTIGRGRKMSEDAVRQAIDGGPYLSDGAVRARLVDELAYQDQVSSSGAIKGTRELDGDQYLNTTPPAPIGGQRIALLYAVGTITSGDSSFDSPSGAVLGARTFTDWVRKVRLDPGIRAVVVRIDSPGGSAIASEVIWRELMLTRDVKPVIVSMGDVAASGGYYIAAPAQTIVAEPGTLTGSIGVVTGKFVVQGALDKLGVGTGSASNGAFAEINSPFKPFSPAERARVEEQMRSTYELFVKRVADGRHEGATKIDGIAQGRVWTGHQARQIGLVDELGGLADAIRIARTQAKLDPAKAIDLVVYPPRRTFYDLLSSSFGASPTAGLDVILGRPNSRALQTAVSTIELFHRGEPLAIMPNVFVR